MSQEEKVYVTCQWCRTEWAIERSLLDNAQLPHILHRFDSSFDQTVSLSPMLRLKGKMAAELVCETDLCAKCSLRIIQGCIRDMIDRGVVTQ